MLTTERIIELSRKEEYSTILDSFNIPWHYPYDNPQLILEYAVTNCHIELFAEFFTTQNVSICTMEKIIKPELYQILESKLENDFELCQRISKIMLSTQLYIVIPEDNEIEFLNIVLKYLATDEFIECVIIYAIRFNNVILLDTLFENNYDIKSAFERMITYNGYHTSNITLVTLLHLSTYGIDITHNLIHFIRMFCNKNNLIGLEYCLDNGIDPNNILNLAENINMDIIKCLLEYNFDVNKLTANQIKKIIYYNSDNPNIIMCLVAHGLALKDTNGLMLWLINVNYLHVAKCLIELGVDIHFDDDLLLFYACRSGKIEFVELLLKYGSMYSSILLFPRINIQKYKYAETKLYMMGDPHAHINIQIARMLIKYGAMITDPLLIFCIYMQCIDKYSLEIDNLFVILLDLGIDLNVKHPFYHRYVFERIIHYPQLIKLCIEYGANPHINNYGPLEEAIRMSDTMSIKLLLDMGSVLNPDLECDVSKDVLNLLDQYQVTHKLKCRT